jgi:crotonobetainyl-CoA:carnitine CoA-transferase CaiB-like acyl-CoA transferase
MKTKSGSPQETPVSDAPLAHLKVLDLTHYRAGPYCTKLFSDYGAEVIKVERPANGDPLRSVGPFAENKPDLEQSIPFLWLNTGKRSVTLNLKHPDAITILTPLIRWADLLVENFSPGVMARLGLDYQAVQAINPRIVMVSLSNFGQTGPYRDYRATEAVLYAMSGGMIATGDRERAPLAAGPAITQYTAGMHAYLGALMALYKRASAGKGDWLDVSIQESALDNVEIHLVEYLHLGKVARRNNDEHAMVPWQCYPCRDGYAAVIGGPIRRWLPAVSLFEEPSLLEDRYRHLSGRQRHRSDFEALLKPWLERNNKMEIYRHGQAHGLAFGFLASLAEAFRSPQHQSRGFFQPLTTESSIGSPEIAGVPFRFSERPAPSPARAPRLGEHNRATFSKFLGYSQADLDRLQAEGVI